MLFCEFLYKYEACSPEHLSITVLYLRVLRTSAQGLAMHSCSRATCLIVR